MELSKAYLAAKMGEQAGKHLNRAMAILEHNTKGGLSKVWPPPSKTRRSPPQGHPSLCGDLRSQSIC